MKITIDPKKGAEAVSGALQKTAEMGKKTVGSVQQGVKALSDKSRADAYLRKMEKYNPVFPEQYESEEFHIPNMIVIVDDAVRRGIDVCEGAIGWLSKEKGMEIFYLYDEAVGASGIKFVPAATCDAAYYVDQFDRNRFIRTDCIFSIAHEEKLAELEHIANALGARRCWIEISEASVEKGFFKKSATLKESVQTSAGKVASGESAEQSAAYQNSASRRGSATAVFKGSSQPQRPKLKWFANDEGVKNLIEAVCSGKNTYESKTLRLSGSSSATMSQKTACEIDAAVGKLGGIKGKTAIESQATKESNRTLEFTIEF